MMTMMADCLVDHVFSASLCREIDCRNMWNRKSTNAKRWWDDKRSIRFFHRYLPYAVYINRLRSVRFRYCFCRTPERVEVKLTAGLSRLLLLVF